jgi:hypothetical protein
MISDPNDISLDVMNHILMVVKSHPSTWYNWGWWILLLYYTSWMHIPS